MRGRWGAILTGLALAAVAITAYLTVVKVTGGTPACAVASGCETVDNSEYSTFAGIPVALFGFGASVAILIGTVLWWRSADIRGLYLAYALGLVSLPILAWLTYLELFVIHAICVWCVTYAITILAGWAGAVIVLRGAR